MEALVGAERIAFACEHARRILVLALEREHTGSEREAAGNVFAELPAEDLAVVFELGQRDLWDVRPREGDRRQRRADFLAADFHDIFVPGVRGLGLRPHIEELPGARVEGSVAVCDQLIESHVAGRPRRVFDRRAIATHNMSVIPAHFGN